MDSLKWHGLVGLEKKLFAYESTRLANVLSVPHHSFNAPFGATNGARLYSLPVFFSVFLDILLSRKYQKIPPPFRNEKTECFLLGILKLNFETSTEWYGN